MSSFLHNLISQMEELDVEEDVEQQRKGDQPYAYKTVENVKAFHRRVLELESLEACYWLKATGFPEYVRMYEERRFPVDPSFVKRNHVYLDDDSMQALLRRLETLNKCTRLIHGKAESKDKGQTSKGYRRCKVALDSDSGRDNLRRSQSSEIMLTADASDVHVERKLSSGNLLEDDDPFDANGNNMSNDVSYSGAFPLMSEDMTDDMASKESSDCDGTVYRKTRNSIYDNVHGSPSRCDVKVAVPSITVEEDESSPYPHGMSTVATRGLPSCSEDDLSSLSSVEGSDAAENGNGLYASAEKTRCNVNGSVDSGVAVSPVLRSPSVRKRRLRWHSFQKSTASDSVILSLKLQNLSAGQMHVLQKISLLRLTALMERYSCNNKSAWHWTVPKLIKKLKVQDFKGKSVFGVPLLTVAQRTGSAVPKAILFAMNYLQTTSVDSIGLFRKSGMKSRIERLKDEIENDATKIDYDSYAMFDIADMLKQYFRELPEPLLTPKLAETFVAIYKDVPRELRLQAMQLAIILMPDEHRETLQTVLSFLSEIAAHSSENQMDEKNLAVCFTPAFFHVCGGKPDKHYAPKKLKRSASGKPDKDLEDAMAAQQCLVEMLKCAKLLFTIPGDVMMKCRFSYIEQGDPISLEELGSNLTGNVGNRGCEAYVDNCFNGLMQESQVKERGWIPHANIDDIDICYKKVDDGYPLRVWRATVELNATPEDVLRRLLKERHLWDDELIEWEVLESINENTDVFYYERQSVAPSIRRDFVTLRSWRSSLPGGTCGLIATSVKHRNAPPESCVRGTLLALRCLIEPTGHCKSNLTYICRLDLRGCSSSYYNKAIGQWTVAGDVQKIRSSFNCGPDGPETNV